MANHHRSPIERFWRQTEQTLGCWFWTGYKRQNGYGAITINYKVVPVHRFAYMQFVGPIADGLVVMHSCDTPLCVNPAHLSVGTVADNKRDSVSKRRHTHGLTHPRHKMNHEQVREIRAAVGRHRDIATRYGIHASTVSFIKAGRTWAHVP